ncbi:hypothetical protein ACJX0J_041949, partial [Zea mays]
ANSMRHSSNCGTESCHRYGGDDHFRLTKRMEASTGAVPSDVQIYLRGHRGPDPANPDVLCSQKATDRVAAYSEAMSSQHGPDYDWRTSPIDSQAVYVSGGKAHGRYTMLANVIDSSQVRVQRGATSTSPRDTRPGAPHLPLIILGLHLLPYLHLHLPNI